MRGMTWKFAASGIVLGAASVTGLVDGFGATPAAAQAQRAGNVDASRLHERAARAVADGLLSEAVGLLEQAVALAPRDAGYRLLLADTYMRSGRFQSAETTYRDVTDSIRRRAGPVFCARPVQVVNATSMRRWRQLERSRAMPRPPDVGPQLTPWPGRRRGNRILEPAARALGATAARPPESRARLCAWRRLARARTIAAQDVPADNSAAHGAMGQLQPSVRQRRPVQALLGVNAVADSGQPVQLAERPARGEARAVPSLPPSRFGPAPAPAQSPARTTSVDIRCRCRPRSGCRPPSHPMPTDAPVCRSPGGGRAGRAVGEAIVCRRPPPSKRRSRPLCRRLCQPRSARRGLYEQAMSRCRRRAGSDPGARARPLPVAAENLVRATPPSMRVANRTASVAPRRPLRAIASGRLPASAPRAASVVVQIGSFSVRPIMPTGAGSIIRRATACAPSVR